MIMRITIGLAHCVRVEARPSGTAKERLCPSMCPSQASLSITVESRSTIRLITLKDMLMMDTYPLSHPMAIPLEVLLTVVMRRALRC